MRPGKPPTLPLRLRQKVRAQHHIAFTSSLPGEFYGDYAVVSELEGRVTILDKNNVPVAFLGDNPQRDQWANYNLDPDNIAPAVFSAAHGCHIDQDANMYVSDWNRYGRVTKLVRVEA